MKRLFTLILTFWMVTGLSLTGYYYLKAEEYKYKYPTPTWNDNHHLAYYYYQDAKTVMIITLVGAIFIYGLSIAFKK